jgi:hypothetical protein
MKTKAVCAIDLQRGSTSSSHRMSVAEKRQMTAGMCRFIGVTVYREGRVNRVNKVNY